jgi:hypothetical protein
LIGLERKVLSWQTRRKRSARTPPATVPQRKAASIAANTARKRVTSQRLAAAANIKLADDEKQESGVRSQKKRKSDSPPYPF